MGGPFGAFTNPTLPRYGIGAGVATELGTLVPSGEVVGYVHHLGAQDGYPDGVNSRVVTTLNRALAYCRSGQNDTVVVLPGHAENISTADQMSNLVAGTRIMGLGNGTLRPKLSWTAATATFLFDVANVSLSNFILDMCPTTNGGVTVAAPITVSAAGCSISGCQIKFGGDADDIVTIGITTTAAADDFSFIDNFCYGATAAECTTFLQIVGADRLVMRGNYIAGATSNVAVGIVRFATTASTDIYLEENVYINRKALSTCAVTGLASTSGISIREHFAYLDTTSLTPWLTSTGIMHFHRPTVTNTAGETGTEVVGTVSA